MLILSRKIGERITLSGGIEIVITRVAGSKVTLGIEAPPEVRIHRSEIPFEERRQKEPCPPAKV